MIFWNIWIVGILLIIAWTDMRIRTIRNKYLLLLLLFSLLKLWGQTDVDWIEQIMGGLLVSLPMLLLTAWIPGCFGGGDIKLMAVSGMMLGKEKIIGAFVIGIWIAGCYIVIRLLRREISMKQEIALGPALCAGVFLQLLM